VDASLTPACVGALERIFKICDADNDNILNDQELNDFQIRCFDAPLQPQALQDVKNIVQHNTPMGVYNDGLTLEGFLFLNKLFILRGRHETTWKVLRRFGYNNSLNLRPDYLYPLFVPQADSNVELSEGGIRFLTKLFNKHDKDGDNALCPNEQEV
jgi:Ras family protein T1